MNQFVERKIFTKIFWQHGKRIQTYKYNTVFLNSSSLITLVTLGKQII